MNQDHSNQYQFRIFGTGKWFDEGKRNEISGEREMAGERAVAMERNLKKGAKGIEARKKSWKFEPLNDARACVYTVHTQTHMHTHISDVCECSAEIFI